MASDCLRLPLIASHGGSGALGAFSAGARCDGRSWATLAHARAHHGALPSPQVRDATGGHGLPPGAARSFVDPKLQLPNSALPSVATLADFEDAYHGGGRYGSHFDTIDGLNVSLERAHVAPPCMQVLTTAPSLPTGLNVSLVCAAATVAGRAWWSLAGGSGTLDANCSLVDELLHCLLPPARRGGRSEGGEAGSGEADAADGHGGGEGGDVPSCALATALGVEGDLRTHYAGVYISAPGSVRVTATARFASAFLKQRLTSACEAIGLAPTTSCEPSILTHDAYPAGIERDLGTGRWRVTDPDEPLWTESNWPNEMYAFLYPHGAPSTVEGLVLLGVGALGALLTYVATYVSRYQYKNAYKRL